jgi:TatD DNase family protein
VQDRDAVIERARRAGVSAMVITGSSLSSSRRAQDICSTPHDSMLYFTAGVHPHDAKSCDGATLPALKALASHPRCCAIGECGLDFDRFATMLQAYHTA